jgi:hypothetical protein
MIKINNRGQHEIVGFVLIVLIVSIVGVIFLSISLGNPEPDKQNSIEISNLLGAIMHHTTKCAINFIPEYKNVQDLIRECYKDKSGNLKECVNGEKVCNNLKIELKDILDKSLDVGIDGINKGYNINIYFNSDDNNNELILNFYEGNFNNCSSIVGGGHSIPVSSFGFGIIETELKVCKN